MNKLVLKLMSSICLVVFSISTHAEHHEKGEAAFSPKALTDNITFLASSKGGNLAVLSGAQGLFLIDANYKDTSAALSAELDKLGGADSLKYIVNTHWHPDHTEGNYAIDDKVLIIAHDNVRERLISPQELKAFNMKTEPYPANAVPDLTFSKKVSLFINGEDIDIIHFANAHTDGDAIVHFKNANIIHMGDLLFNGFYPFVDLAHGGNVMNKAKAIEAILTLVDEETVIIPGHGPLANKAELIAFKDMLIGTHAEVKAMKESGKSLEEAQAVGLSDKWAEWRDGFLDDATWISFNWGSTEE